MAILLAESSGSILRLYMAILLVKSNGSYAPPPSYSDWLTFITSESRALPLLRTPSVCSTTDRKPTLFK